MKAFTAFWSQQTLTHTHTSPHTHTQTQYIWCESFLNERFITIIIEWLSVCHLRKTAQVNLFKN